MKHLTVLVIVLILSGCQAAPLPSAPAHAVAGLVSELRLAGAEVTALGPFNTDPLGGRGTRLCVAGQEISVYEFQTVEERAASSGAIDPADPSKVGVGMIVEWAGDPKFWQRDRILVLYLGSDPGIEAGLTSVMGPPFAKGLGRDPGPQGHSC